MSTFKITWYKGMFSNPYMTGDNLIIANSDDEAIEIFNKEYLSRGRVWDSVVNCSTPEYQLAYDNDQFDSNGRRKF